MFHDEVWLLFWTQPNLSGRSPSIDDKPAAYEPDYQALKIIWVNTIYGTIQFSLAWKWRDAALNSESERDFSEQNKGTLQLLLDMS